MKKKRIAMGKKVKETVSTGRSEFIKRDNLYPLGLPIANQ